MNLHFTFFTVTFLDNKNVVQLAKYFLILSVCAPVGDTVVYHCYYIEAAEAKSIQTNLRVKHVWNLIYYAGTKKCFYPKKCYSHSLIYCYFINYWLLVIFLYQICSPFPPLTTTTPPSIPDMTAVVDNCQN